MYDVKGNLHEVLGSLPAGVRLVAISKFHPNEYIEAAYAEGQRIFGESHEQELSKKVETLPKDIEWHFIGHLQTNLKKYDETMVYTDLYTAVKLNGWMDDQTSGAELTVNDFDKLNETEDYIINKVNRTVDHYGETYSSATIKDLNPNIFQWLGLMDLNVWIILALMLVVAGVTMISGLLIIILERTSMIGVLKALGARNRTIRHTFLWFAVFIIGKGMLLGNIIALAILAVQYFTGVLKLDAQTYYVSTVPVEFNWLFIVALNVATLLISVFMLVAPSYLISHIHPAKSMRYE
jgi:lipoprotein-releasing system permease protein